MDENFSRSEATETFNNYKKWALSLNIPENIINQLTHYIVYGEKPVIYLQYLLENNFIKASSFSGGWCSYFGAVSQMLYLHAPVECYGTSQQVKDWVEKGGLIGKQPEKLIVDKTPVSKEIVNRLVNRIVTQEYRWDNNEYVWVGSTTTGLREDHLWEVAQKIHPTLSPNQQEAMEKDLEDNRQHPHKYAKNKDFKEAIILCEWEYGIRS